MKAMQSPWRLAGILGAMTLLSPLGAAAAPAKPAPAAALGDGLAAFETIRAVLQHPRCQNCHIPGDAPLQFDAGLPHAQNVLRGPDGRGVPGLPCATCHGAANPPASYGPHLPPGIPDWHMPPPEQKMVFIGLQPAELCATIKDRQRNGGRDLQGLFEHMSHDKIVLWGWDPGVGRAPVSVPHDTLVAAMKTWIAAGAPCPPGASGAK